MKSLFDTAMATLLFPFRLAPQFLARPHSPSPAPRRAA